MRNYFFFREIHFSIHASQQSELLLLPFVWIFMDSSRNILVISQQLTVYVGVSISLIGLIGCSLNVVVFISLRTFRENSCAFYLLVVSLSNIGHLLSTALPRVITTAFSINTSYFSLMHCKIRLFVSIVTAQISFTCLCLAVLDQYAAINSRPRWRKFSQIVVAHRLTLIFTILWLLHGIPFIIYLGEFQSPLSKQILCTTIDPKFTKYRVYFAGIILNGVIPLITSSYFGVLAYRNVRDIAYRTIPIVRRSMDKQLTAMTLTHVFVNCLTTLPYFVNNILFSNIESESDRSMEKQFHVTLSITILVFFVGIAVSFPIL